MDTRETSELSYTAACVLTLWTQPSVYDARGTGADASAKPLVVRDTYRIAERKIARALDKGMPLRRERESRLQEILGLIALPPAQDDLLATLNLAKFGIAMAHELADTKADITLRGLSGAVHAMLGHFSRAVIYCEAALRRAQGAGQLADEARARATLSYAFGELGEFTLARLHRERLVELISGIEGRLLTAQISSCLAIDMCRDGLAKDAMRFVEHSLEQHALLRDSVSTGPIHLAAALVAIRCRLPELAGLRMAQAEAALQVQPSRRFREELRLAQLEIALLSDDAATARTLVDSMPVRFEVLRMSHRALRAAELAFRLTIQSPSENPALVTRAVRQLRRAQLRYASEQHFQQRWLLKKVRETITTQLAQQQQRDQSIALGLRRLNEELAAPKRERRSSSPAA